jgi:hypothetical protein
LDILYLWVFVFLLWRQEMLRLAAALLCWFWSSRGPAWQREVTGLAACSVARLSASEMAILVWGQPLRSSLYPGYCPQQVQNEPLPLLQVDSGSQCLLGGTTGLTGLSWSELGRSFCWEVFTIHRLACLSLYTEAIFFLYCVFRSSLKVLLCVKGTWASFLVPVWVAFDWLIDWLICGTGVWTQGLHHEPLYQPFFVMGFFRVGSQELFALPGFKPQSSWSLPPE